MTSVLSSAEYRAMKPRKNKYRAVKTKVGDIEFHSKREAARYVVLLDRLKRGEIRNLELQVPIPVKLNGKKVFTYIADFIYFEGPNRIIDDSKGFKTPVYRLKKRILEAHLGVKIRES
jgi:hypothetical protein